MRRMMGIAGALLMLAAPAQAEPLVGQATVIDGDTLDVRGTRIRMHGIDAPESSQLCYRDSQPWRCGQAAAIALADLVGRKHVSCEAKDTDRYGRMVAICHLGDVDLNAWMVGQGWAMAYTQYSRDYMAQEARAKGAGLGIWGTEFDAPWDWRRGTRKAGRPVEPVIVPTAGECVIKGNINAKGQRIYHVPGGQFYAKTRINEAEGERIFCSEAEATAAGFRRSQR